MSLFSIILIDFILKNTFIDLNFTLNIYLFTKIGKLYDFAHKYQFIPLLTLYFCE